MTIWDWIHEYELQALEAGDVDRLRMTRLHSEAYNYRQTDPDHMLALLEEGSRLAHRFREPWWILFFEHWKVETLIYYKDDYRDVIDLSVRQTLELRKPPFENYPLRFGIYCNLVAAYLCVDPRGHSRAIREAIEYLQTLVTPDTSDRYLLQARRHWFAYELGDYDEALRLALEELSFCDSDPDRHTARHHEVDTYKALCWISYRRKDFTALHEYAQIGEARARAIGYRYELALCLIWQALCLRRDGQREQSSRLVRQGTTQMSRLGQPPGESYYDALVAYYELEGKLDAAWDLRERELATTLGKGQLAYEALVRIKRVRMLTRMGLPINDEHHAAKEAIGRLRSPEWYQERLQHAVRGED